MGRRANFPLREMAVGESWFFPGEPDSARVHKTATRMKPWRFMAKQWLVNGIPGVMVWRIA